MRKAEALLIQEMKLKEDDKDEWDSFSESPTIKRGFDKLEPMRLSFREDFRRSYDSDWAYGGGSHDNKGIKAANISRDGEMTKADIEHICSVTSPHRFLVLAAAAVMMIIAVSSTQHYCV